MGIMNKVDLFQKGTWSNKDSLPFNGDDFNEGAMITNNGNTIIETIPIDDAIRGGSNFY